MFGLRQTFTYKYVAASGQFSLPRYTIEVSKMKPLHLALATLPHIAILIEALSGIWVRHMPQLGSIPTARDMFASAYRRDTNSLVVAGGYDPATTNYLNGKYSSSYK